MVVLLEDAKPWVGVRTENGFGIVGAAIDDNDQFEILEVLVQTGVQLTRECERRRYTSAG